MQCRLSQNEIFSEWAIGGNRRRAARGSKNNDFWLLIINFDAMMLDADAISRFWYWNCSASHLGIDTKASLQICRRAIWFLRASAMKTNFHENWIKKLIKSWQRPICGSGNRNPISAIFLKFSEKLFHLSRTLATASWTLTVAVFN